VISIHLWRCAYGGWREHNNSESESCGGTSTHISIHGLERCQEAKVCTSMNSFPVRAHRKIIEVAISRFHSPEPQPGTALGLPMCHRRWSWGIQYNRSNDWTSGVHHPIHSVQTGTSHEHKCLCERTPLVVPAVDFAPVRSGAVGTKSIKESRVTAIDLQTRSQSCVRQQLLIAPSTSRRHGCSQVPA